MPSPNLGKVVRAALSMSGKPYKWQASADGFECGEFVKATAGLVDAGDWAPDLITVPDIELLEVGEDWETSTGLFTWEPEDLLSAIASQEDPAVRSPVIKLGHEDPRFDGEPVFGRIQNLRVVNNGQTLNGDLVGVPRWLAEVMPTAYPRRSIEGYFRATTRTGNAWPFILTACALLGSAYPAINTLEDLKILWGSEPPPLYELGEDDAPEVAADAGGLIRARRVTPVAKLKKGTVPGIGGEVRASAAKASVSTSDVQREWYAQLEGPMSWWWIRQVLVNPFQLVVDDDEGGLYLVDVSVSAADEITFGEAKPVKVEYVAATQSGLAEVHRDGQVVVASYEEATASGGKVKDQQEDDEEEDDEEEDDEDTDTEAEEDGVKLTPDALKRLGLAEDATEEQINAAIVAMAQTSDDAGDEDADDGDDGGADGNPQSQPQTPATNPAGQPAQTPTTANPPVTTPGTTVPEGMVLVDQSQWSEVQQEVAASASERKKRAKQERDNFIAAACQAGKFPRARVAHYTQLWDADPAGTKVLIDSLAAGLVPTQEVGTSGETDPDVAASAYPDSWKRDHRVAAQRHSVNTRIKVVND